jgi:hypothetical protein
MEWISVKDRLPEKDIPVLCYDGTYIDVGEYWYDENDKPVFFNPPSPPKDYITHWMPLPKPPEKKEKQ